MAITPGRRKKTIAQTLLPELGNTDILWAQATFCNGTTSRNCLLLTVLIGIEFSFKHGISYLHEHEVFRLGEVVQLLTLAVIGSEALLTENMLPSMQHHLTHIVVAAGNVSNINGICNRGIQLRYVNNWEYLARLTGTANRSAQSSSDSETTFVRFSNTAYWQRSVG